MAKAMAVVPGITRRRVVDVADRTSLAVGSYEEKQFWRAISADCSIQEGIDVKKALVGIMIAAFCSSCLAGDNDVLAIAKSNYNQSISDLDIVEAKCKESEVVLGENIFSNVPANNEELRAALIYFNYKAKTACAEAAVKNYLMSSAILYSLDITQKEHILIANALIVESNVQLLKYKQSYDALPDALRRAFNKIKALNRPFDLVGTLNNIGAN